MDNRVAVIAIIVEDYSSTSELNQLLHDYRDYIIGRMGIPYDKRNVAIISVALDAPGDKINALTGKLGMLSGVSSKTLFSKIDDSRA